MRPVRQTIFAGPEGDANGDVGNCLQACLASILDLDLVDVPHFAELEEPGAWWKAMCTWTAARYELTWTVAADIDDLDEVHWRVDRSDARILMAGPSPRGPHGHVVVSDGYGHMLHDPHPDGTGLADGERRFYLLCPIDDEVGA